MNQRLNRIVCQSIDQFTHNGLWYATVLAAPGIDRVFDMNANAQDFLTSGDISAGIIMMLKALEVKRDPTNRRKK